MSDSPSCKREPAMPDNKPETASHRNSLSALPLTAAHERDARP